MAQHTIAKCKICGVNINQCLLSHYDEAIEYSLCDKHKEFVTSKFLKSNMPFDEFIEMIQSTDIQVTPQKSPYPHNFKKDEKEDENDYNDLEWELDD